MKSTRQLNLIALTALVLGSLNLNIKAEAAVNAQKYIPTEFVSGFNPDLGLELHEKSSNLDLAKTRNIRVRLKARNLFASIPNSGSFKIELYSVTPGQADEFLSNQTVTINRGDTDRNRIISIDAGKFTGDSKTIKFVVYDTENNYVNTYQTTITATNLSTQPTTTSNIDLPETQCGTEFGDCQLEQFFRRVTFEAKKQRQASTRVIKEADGFYKVTIPLPRTGFRAYRGSRVRTAQVGGGNGTGGGTSAFGETIEASTIKLGSGATDHVKFGYDTASNQLELSFPTGVTNGFVIDDQARVGIGVDPVTAFLNVRGGTTTTPSIKVNPGVLTTTPQDGAIEYDGTQLYFTKGTVRNPIGTGATGAQGPQGPAGPAGAAGAAGAKGDTGTIAANTGGTIGGPLTFNNNSSIVGSNIPLNGTINGGTLKNTTISAPEATLGKLFLDSSSQPSLTNTTAITANTVIIRVQGATGPVDYANGFTQITTVGAKEGQMLILKGMSNTNTVTLDEGDGLELNGGTKLIMGRGDTITFVFDAVVGKWVEISRTDVI